MTPTPTSWPLGLALLSLSTALWAAPPLNSSVQEGRFYAGVGLATAPEYLGSKRLKVGPAVDIGYDFGNGLSVGSQGLGFQYAYPLNASLSLLAGAHIGYLPAREDKKELKGMGKVKGSVTSTFNTGLQLDDYLALHAGAELALSESKNGHSYYVRAAIPVLKKEHDQITLSGSAHYFDQKRMQTYLGVSTVQSRRSGHQAYSPKAGIGQVGAELEWVHQFNGPWSLTMTGGMTQLVGDAKDSPLAKRKTAPVASVLATYTF
ncbi:MAG: MipA/OmpV family protein [Neisseriaceae bacterium]|nr:MipA/OmpV family protein [Neisseriaceae bacterium]